MVLMGHSSLTTTLGYSKLDDANSVTCLTWADVDLDQGSFLVHGSKKARKCTCCLGPNTKQFLVSLRELRPDDIYILGGVSPKRVDHIARRFRLVSKDLGLAENGLHYLRVSFFMCLISVSADDSTLASLRYGSKRWHFLQSNLQETAAVYYHLFDEV